MYINLTNIMLKKRCKIQKSIELYTSIITVFRKVSTGTKTEKKKGGGLLSKKSRSLLLLADRKQLDLGKNPEASGCWQCSIS